MVVLGKVRGNGIKSVELHQTVGLVDTYRITFDDDTYFDFDVKNAKDAPNIEVLAELPETGTKGVLYFIPTESVATSNRFDEYVWLGTEYEFMGTPALSLQNYYTKAEVDALIQNVIDDRTTILTFEKDDGTTGSFKVLDYIEDD